MYKEILKKSLDDISKSFEADELAYLSLTSKIENPLRDRLAYRLHSDFGKASTIAAREWKRRDLVILENELPKAIIEMKAMYIFDAAKDKKISGFSDNLIDDMGKAKKHLNGSDVYGLLLATDPHAIIDRKYKDIVKYLGGINSALEINHHDELLKKAKSNISHAFKGYETVASGELTGGAAFGVQVSVHYWLFTA